jgi:hypothetical protein
MVSPLNMQPDGGGFAEGGGIGERLKDFRPFLVFGVAALVIIAVAVFLVIMVSGGGGKQPVAKPTTPQITPTPSVSTTPAQVTEPGGPTPTPAPAKTAFLDAMNITSAQPSVYKKAWNFHSGGTPPQLTISDKHYANGLGLYIPSTTILKTQGTMNITCKLDDAYDTLTFDLGVDSNLQYEAGHGQFRVQIYLDSTHYNPAYDSGLNGYDFTQMGQIVKITGASSLIIKLTEVKGAKKGTINVVMGNCLLTKNGNGSPADTSSASVSPGSSVSASPSPSPSPTASNAGGGGGNPNASLPLQTEQALPPG